MLKNQKSLAQSALKEALRTRAVVGAKPWDPICVYDLVQTIGVELRFVTIPSLEGMYLKTPHPLILVSSERPSGRQRFSCAHELGHHIFNHGHKVDQMLEPRRPNAHSELEEFIADCFAGFLLMPKSALTRGFSSRGFDPSNCTPVDVYAVACWLGVGYTTIIQHMQWSLRLISESRAKALLRHSPKSIRKEILGEEIQEDMILVDTNWTGRSIDIHVGDLIVTTMDVESDGSVIRRVEGMSTGYIYCALSPGVTRLHCRSSKWSAYVRVSRRGFSGRSIFRHLEEVGED